MAKEFNYASCQKKLEALKEKTIALLRETQNENLIHQLGRELELTSEREKLSLAFVGQYSSGKSTIISALTGRKDIKIDANVSTDEISAYEWNRVILMDTPGILAGKVEAHDEKTKEALKECDLIFYVLTSQLFDNVVFNNFIDLAYNQHFSDKMFIVVNKMGMEAGHFEKQIEVYQKSLEKIFNDRGYDVNNFPITFIDAADYIEGKESGDEEFVKLSNFEAFIGMLNAFVESKGLIKKQFDTPIRVLQSYLNNIIVSAVDKTLSDFYSQFEMKLSNCMSEIKRDARNVLSSFGTSVMSKVVNLSSDIGYIESQDWEHKQDELNKEIVSSIENTSSEIEQAIMQNYDRLLLSVENFAGKDALVKYEEGLNAKINAPNISIDEQKNLAIQKKSLEYLRQGGAWLSKQAPNVTKLGGGISKASGSELHKSVLEIGHFFGKRFKPWEGVRWASKYS